MSEQTTDDLIKLLNRDSKTVESGPFSTLLFLSANRLQQQADEIDGWRKRVISLEVDFDDLKVKINNTITQLTWAITHYKVVDTDGIFQELVNTLNELKDKNDRQT